MSSKGSSPTSVGGTKVHMSGSDAGRNKIALKPGKSLMDWIRYTHSDKDLTSVGGKVLDVTSEELSKHCKREDAWICLRGKVYNITPYLEYHPGGKDELMRGAGKDATDLFNEIHRWVNAESMLQKCYVGRMNMSSLWLQKATALCPPRLPSKKAATVKSFAQEPETNGAEIRIVESVVGEVQAPIKKMQKPRFEWIQSERHVSISICSQAALIRLEHVITDLVARDLFVMLYMNNYLYSLHLELEGTVSPMYDVKVTESGDMIEVILSKNSSEGLWEELGKPLSYHDTFLKTADKEIRYRPCKLLSKTCVARDTYLLSCELPSGSRMIVPIGHHIYLKAHVDGMEIIRSYTPVLHSFDIPSSHSSLTEGRLIHLMIKVYPDGTLTPLISKCKIGETLLISDYAGSFSEDRLHECSSLILLAAGTGFTPMIKLIHWALELESHQNRSVVLVFFNKTKEDILWKNELDSLCQKNARFQVHHVLSEPDEEWVGRKGRISFHLLQDLFKDSLVLPGTFVCVCGPSAFTQLTVQYLEDLECSKNSIHAFCG